MSDEIKFDRNALVSLRDQKPTCERDAVYVSLMKWHARNPARGQGSSATCGLCLYYPNCKNCALFKLWGTSCNGRYTPFNLWSYDISENEKSKYADQIYNDLLKIWNNWNNLNKESPKPCPQ